MGMSLVVKQFDGVWKVKGSADPDSNYQSPIPANGYDINGVPKPFTAGDYVDFLFRKYSISTIQILGE